LIRTSGLFFVRAKQQTRPDSCRLAATLGGGQQRRPLTFARGAFTALMFYSASITSNFNGAGFPFNASFCSGKPGLRLRFEQFAEGVCEFIFFQRSEKARFSWRQSDLRIRGRSKYCPVAAFPAASALRHRFESLSPPVPMRPLRGIAGDAARPNARIHVGASLLAFPFLPWNFNCFRKPYQPPDPAPVHGSP